MALSLKSRLQEMNSRRPRLTLLGRSLLLLSTELAVNAVCWIVTGILFGRKRSTQPILSLALLAWTIGLRHALDADHISAIDNATRSLIGMGQLPVTCGLFFSLGHSTIVIVVNVAIAISTDVYNHIGGVGEVGGIIGAAVSGSFLFIVGLGNSILLWRVLVKRRKWKLERTERIAGGESEQAVDDDIAARAEKSHGNTLMMKIIGPIVTFVDRPWKMYPVGVLFGFGFDTASSIALLAVSAIAKKDSDGNQIAPADIVILPLLFTAGMTMVDSLDSILMLYSYAGFPERGFALFERPTRVPVETTQGSVPSVEVLPPSPRKTPSPTGDIEETVPQLSTTSLHRIASSSKASTADDDEEPTLTKEDLVRQRQMRMRHNAMSGLSIMLTLMSIFVAFAISLITIMGLIGDNCTACQDAANDPNGGGLAGRWWRGWANANDQSGYIGAAIVGSFVTVVGIWYGGRYAWRRYRQGQTI